MTKEKQNNIPKAKYPWAWECESRTLIFGELAITAFLAFLLTSAHAALIQMEVCVVLLPIVIHLLMRAMTFAGLYIILRIKRQHPMSFWYIAILQAMTVRRE